MRRNIAVLGSTGSIGRQTLDVAREFPEKVRVWGLAAHTDSTRLFKQAAEVRPELIVLTNPPAALERPPGQTMLTGQEGMVALVCEPEVDLVVVGTSGAAGLLPTLAALRAGKLVALANKETLVMAGVLIQEELRSGAGALVPIDSEHSAVWQCLQGEPHRAIERLTLTASGGALRGLAQDELERVTPGQALQHPTWTMGPKITIDSANLMNKGLEAIEARWLFDVPIEKVDIVLHPQSIVHSLVTFDDGSTKAQLGLPDMRLPIQYALSHPERWPSNLPRLDLAATGNLSFQPLDRARYPAVGLALEAARLGGTYPAVLAAADEIAVNAFLRGAISFITIPWIVEETLARHTPCPAPTLDDILAADTWARSAALDLTAG